MFGRKKKTTAKNALYLDTPEYEYIVKADNLVYEFKDTDEEGNETECFRAVDGVSLNVSQGDFIAILGNAMENAIHGCEESGREEKRISVYLKQKQDKLAIRISNTCPEKISFQNGLPVRKDGGGIGISSILRSVKKYKGEADFTVESGEFVARILLQILEKQAE